MAAIPPRREAEGGRPDRSSCYPFSPLAQFHRARNRRTGSLLLGWCVFRRSKIRSILGPIRNHRLRQTALEEGGVGQVKSDPRSRVIYSGRGSLPSFLPSSRPSQLCWCLKRAINAPCHDRFRDPFLSSPLLSSSATWPTRCSRKHLKSRWILLVFRSGCQYFR